MAASTAEAEVPSEDWLACTEEAELLQELDDLQAKLFEKESTLKEIAAAEALLRDEFAASLAEARQLSLQVAQLEPVLGTDSELRDRDVLQETVENEPSTLREDTAAESKANDISDDLLRARLAMGLAVSSS